MKPPPPSPQGWQLYVINKVTAELFIIFIDYYWHFLKWGIGQDICDGIIVIIVKTISSSSSWTVGLGPSLQSFNVLFLLVHFRFQYQRINLVWLSFDFFPFSWSFTVWFFCDYTLCAVAQKYGMSYNYSHFQYSFCN